MGNEAVSTGAVALLPLGAQQQGDAAPNPDGASPLGHPPTASCSLNYSCTNPTDMVPSPFGTARACALGRCPHAIHKISFYHKISPSALLNQHFFSTSVSLHLNTPICSFRGKGLLCGLQTDGYSMCYLYMAPTPCSQHAYRRLTMSSGITLHYTRLFAST